MSEIGKRIKEIRISAGMTQEELAKKVGYKNKSTIAKIENGTNDISQSKVADFAAALNTSIPNLMAWDYAFNDAPQKSLTSNTHIWLPSPETGKTQILSKAISITTNESENDLHLLIDIYCNLPDETKTRLLTYATKLNELYQEEKLIYSNIPE